MDAASRRSISKQHFEIAAALGRSKIEFGGELQQCVCLAASSQSVVGFDKQFEFDKTPESIEFIECAVNFVSSTASCERQRFRSAYERRRPA